MFDPRAAKAGTPTISAKSSYDAAAQSFKLTLTQSTPATPGQPEKLPFHIPVEIGLLGKDGSLLESTTLELVENEQTFEFSGIAEEPIPSLLRGFSAPVKLEIARSDEQLAFLAANDDDPFNKWDASQRLASRVLLDLASQLQTDAATELRLGSGLTRTRTLTLTLTLALTLALALTLTSLPDGLVAAFRSTLTATDLDNSLQASP